MADLRCEIAGVKSPDDDVDFGPAAPLDGNLAQDYWDLRLRWFDHWMLGVKNGVDQEPAVRYFRMGGGTGRKNAFNGHGGQNRRWNIASGSSQQAGFSPDNHGYGIIRPVVNVTVMVQYGI